MRLFTYTLLKIFFVVEWFVGSPFLGGHVMAEATDSVDTNSLTFKNEIKGVEPIVRKLNTNLKTLLRNSPSMHNNREWIHHECARDICSSSLVPPVDQSCVCVECGKVHQASVMSFVFVSVSFMGWTPYCPSCATQVLSRSARFVASSHRSD